ncbi:hypothetical protein SmJEL517_g00210 [Synchytrium microbalum]|uniref:Transcriptional adapter 2 n=1 Tax=Synchytrium microbalum TaxID=1806994 RepID=A0A507CK27_9FUNG|nr:uncharacterized protein SmJEL517_g00210 [Synchytrium microbalum]TPX38235.1 hypothetical protein SmJEL517_g00210 [Synchytrium microbalum]
MTVTRKRRKFVKEGEEQPADANDDDFGQKYHCDVCEKDISPVVRIRCAACPDYDLCVECFASGKETGTHQNDHPYRVIQVLDFPIFDKDWTAEEELLLVEGLEIFGMGNWDQVSEHLGNKSAPECKAHYINTYIANPDWPMPDMNKEFDPAQKKKWSWSTAIPKKVAPGPKNARPLTSGPTNHDIAGYMPGRFEFETEYENEHEQNVKDMTFDETDDPHESDLKVAVLDAYNTILDRRQLRRKFIFDRGFLDFRKIQNQEKKRTKDEKDLLQKIRVYAKMQTAEDFDNFVEGLAAEQKLRDRIQLLQRWRRMGITSMKEAQDYEREMEKRSNPATKGWPAYPAPDRSSSTGRQTVRTKFDDYVTTPIARDATPNAPLRANSFGPGSSAPLSATPYAVPTTSGRPPPASLDITTADGVGLLSPAEQSLCSALRLVPRAYLVIKETLLKEQQSKGHLKKRAARELVRIDVNKTAKIYDFFYEMGWVSPEQ